MRLAKHLAHAGVASRRASEQLIFDGRVAVDGEIVTDPARDVTGGERIEVDGERIGGAPGVRVVYALHKPAGVVSTASDTHGRPTVVDLVRAPGDRRLYPVGRLDADTTGLILLTDDGDLAHRLTHPRFEVPKTYRVTTRTFVTDGAIRRLAQGVRLDDGPTAPAKVERRGPREFDIAIHEGRKRQVRRMCDAVGAPVKRLQRIRFGPLSLGRLSEGEARRLLPAEVDALRAAAARGPGWDDPRPMRLHALRGAITVDANDRDQILDATEELMRELLERNALEPAAIVNCIFTMTEDLNAEFPAVAARRMGFDRVPLLCVREIDVPGALPRVIRVLVQYHADGGHEAQHVYLREAKALRTDLTSAQ